MNEKAIFVSHRLEDVDELFVLLHEELFCDAEQNFNLPGYFRDLHFFTQQRSR